MKAHRVRVAATAAAGLFLLSAFPAEPPAATRRMMEARISLFDLFLETMEDAFDGAATMIPQKDLPLLWNIAYDRGKDLLAFTFSRTLEGEEAKAALAGTAEERKERMGRVLDQLAPVVGIAPAPGGEAPMGLLQITPIRAKTKDERAAGELMRRELVERAMIVLVWRTPGRVCVAARARGVDEIQYEETDVPPPTERSARTP
jgi:hypothetical protein